MNEEYGNLQAQMSFQAKVHEAPKRQQKFPGIGLARTDRWAEESNENVSFDKLWQTPQIFQHTNANRLEATRKPVGLRSEERDMLDTMEQQNPL